MFFGEAGDIFSRQLLIYEDNVRFHAEGFGGKIPRENILISNFVLTAVTNCVTWDVCSSSKKEERWPRMGYLPLNGRQTEGFTACFLSFQSDRLKLKQQYLELCGVFGDLRPNPWKLINFAVTCTPRSQASHLSFSNSVCVRVCVLAHLTSKYIQIAHVRMMQNRLLFFFSWAIVALLCV